MWKVTYEMLSGKINLKKEYGLFLYKKYMHGKNFGEYYTIIVIEFCLGIMIASDFYFIFYYILISC